MLAKKFNVILARAKNGGIGLGNTLPWKSKKDMDFFKTTTSFSPFEGLLNIVIMGRKTMESLPKKYLPNRINIVISTDESKVDKSLVHYAHSFNNAISLANSLPHHKTFVIGGKSIYEQAFNHYLLGDVYHTIIDKEFKCDTFVNLPPKMEWQSESIVTENDFNLKFQIGRVNNGETQYLQLLSEIMNTGEKRLGRNGYTYSLFGRELKFDLDQGFPLLTTKRMFWKGIVEELLFFIRGNTNSKLLEEKGVNIWKGNTSKEFIEKCKLPYDEGDMGEIYGFNWRHFGAKYKDCKTDYAGKGFDQLHKVVEEIKSNPTSRRIIMTDFNPATAHKGVLYPCHSLILQFYVEGSKLSVKMYQRSQDEFLGCPFNIASTALLLEIICKLTNLKPKNMIMTIGDAHIYDLHLEQVKKQLSRIPYQLPKLELPNFKTIEEVEKSKLEDYVISEYEHYKGIKADMVA